MNSHKVCAVASCKNPDFVIYHQFPKDKKLQKIWLNACRRQDKVNVRSASICERHFHEEKYERDLKHELLNLPLRKKLKKDAVPTLNLLPEGPSSNTSSAESCSNGRGAAKGRESRETRQHKRDLKKQVQEFVTRSPEETKVNAAVQCSLASDLKWTLETEITQTRVSLLKEKAKVCRLQKEIKRLKSRKCGGACAKAILRQRFSMAQTKKLLYPKRKWAHYSKEDIVSALVLRSISSKAFSHLYKNGPLLMPSRRTQERWLRTFRCDPDQEDSTHVPKEMSNDDIKVCPAE